MFSRPTGVTMPLVTLERTRPIRKPEGLSGSWSVWGLSYPAFSSLARNQEDR